MIKKNNTTIDQSREFGITEKFFSITDKRGVILCGNDVFMRVSDYEPIEVLNKPHNVIRHPDMPRCIFDLFWQYLNEGKVIGAYVKNLAKDGKYYWVYALVSLLDEQFVSIRIKPSSDIFPVVEALYKELLQHESSFSGSRHDAMKSSGELLTKRLNELNFSSYDEFFYTSLRSELKLHNTAVQKADLASKFSDNKDRSYGIRHLIRVFDNLDRLTEYGKAIEAKHTCFLSLEKELHTISTNTKFRASRLGSDGKPLGVLSDEISRARTDIGAEFSRLTKDIKAISNAVNGATLHSCLGLLQVQMQQEYSDAMTHSDESEKEQIAHYGLAFVDMNKTLQSARESSLRSFKKEINALSNSLNDFRGFILFLSRMIQVLDFTYVTGQSLAASIGNAAEVSEILSGLKVIASRSSKDLTELRGLVSEVTSLVE